MPTVTETRPRPNPDSKRQSKDTIQNQIPIQTSDRIYMRRIWVLTISWSTRSQKLRR